jgi:hydrogenase maturation protease
MAARRVLVIGYGNPGRRDDGLGPALAAEMEARKLPGLDVDSDYQLTVEDSHAVAGYDLVIFADAALEGREPFYFRPLEGRLDGPAGGLSSHGVEAEEVLALAGELFGSRPEAYVLGIRGYEFGRFEEGLSARARANLTAARDFLVRVIREGNFAAAVTD